MITKILHSIPLMCALALAASCSMSNRHGVHDDTPDADAPSRYAHIPSATPPSEEALSYVFMHDGRQITTPTQLERAGRLIFFLTGSLDPQRRDGTPLSTLVGEPKQYLVPFYIPEGKEVDPDTLKRMTIRSAYEKGWLRLESGKAAVDAAEKLAELKLAAAFRRLQQGTMLRYATIIDSEGHELTYYHSFDDLAAHRAHFLDWLKYYKIKHQDDPTKQIYVIYGSTKSYPPQPSRQVLPLPGYKLALETDAAGHIPKRFLIPIAANGQPSNQMIPADERCRPLIDASNQNVDTYKNALKEGHTLITDSVYALLVDDSARIHKVFLHPNALTKATKPLVFPAAANPSVAQTFDLVTQLHIVTGSAALMRSLEGAEPGDHGLSQRHQRAPEDPTSTFAFMQHDTVARITVDLNRRPQTAVRYGSKVVKQALLDARSYSSHGGYDRYAYSDGSKRVVVRISRGLNTLEQNYANAQRDKQDYAVAAGLYTSDIFALMLERQLPEKGRLYDTERLAYEVVPLHDIHQYRRERNRLMKETGNGQPQSARDVIGQIELTREREREEKLPCEGDTEVFYVKRNDETYQIMFVSGRRLLEENVRIQSQLTQNGDKVKRALEKLDAWENKRLLLAELEHRGLALWEGGGPRDIAQHMEVSDRWPG